MDKEEQIKTLLDDINTDLDFDGTCECVKEDGECYPNYQVIIETPALAKRLVNRGWNKTIWHKVADGDLPKNDSVVLAFYKPGYYGTKLYLKTPMVKVGGMVRASVKLKI